MKKYFIDIQKKYSFNKILLYSIVIGIFIFWLDYYNLLSHLISFSKNGGYSPILIGIAIIISLFVIKEIGNKRLLRLPIENFVNIFDYSLFLILFSIAVYLVFVMCFMKTNNFIAFILLPILILLITLRCFIFCSKAKGIVKNNYKIYTISDLYNYNIDENQDLIILRERALDDEKNDVLDYKLFVDNLEKNIVNYKSDETITIGLIGKWGSGKTTIINMLKQRLKQYTDITIGLFSPWVYEGNVNLFKGFFEFICNLSNQKYGLFEYKKLLNKYLNLISNVSFKSIDLSLGNFFRINNDDYIDIKNKINSIISTSNKKIVIVIDDIDRLSAEEMLFTFKVIKNLFDFDNIIYILCYDEDQINNVFEKEFNFMPEYINKFIQTKIYLPTIESSKINNIGHICMRNLLKKYDINMIDEARYKRVTHSIFANMDNLRELIRFINSISMNINLCKYLELDICDYMSLKYIEHVDSSLYRKILDSCISLISMDTFNKANTAGISFHSDYSVNVAYDVKNRFINSINSEYIRNLVKELFPNLEVEKGLREIHSNMRNIRLFRRCCSGRYFYRYFYVNEDTYLRVNKIVNGFIELLNNGNSVLDALNTYIKDIDNNQQIFFDLLATNIKKLYSLENIFYFFMSTNHFEERNINILLAAIIANSDDSLFDSYLDKLLEVKTIIQYESIVSQISNGWDKDDIVDLANKKLYKFVNKCIYENINIFNTIPYEHRVCIKFFEIARDEDKVKNYFTSLLDKSTVFKIIGECMIRNNIKGTYKYKFDNTILSKLVYTNKLNKILKDINIEELNNDQSIVLDLFESNEEKNVEINFANL